MEGLISCCRGYQKQTVIDGFPIPDNPNPSIIDHQLQGKHGLSDVHKWSLGINLIEYQVNTVTGTIGKSLQGQERKIKAKFVTNKG
jgi:hypothetical protein